MSLLRSATELISDIQLRFKRGDAAQEQVARLVTQTKLIQKYVARFGGELTSECRARIAMLIQEVQTAVSGGNAWLSRAAGPELAYQVLRQRICKTYGLPTRNN
jgi:hypothetical protein